MARSTFESLGGGIEYRYDNFIFSGELSNSNIDIEGFDIETWAPWGLNTPLAQRLNIGLDVYIAFSTLRGMDDDVTASSGFVSVRRTHFWCLRSGEFL